jgi:hypothetical protein
MKHVRPISKAATTNGTTGDLIAMVLALLQAIAPIITWLIESKASETN